MQEVARLERWWWSTTDGGAVYLKGEVHNDQPPRSLQDGDFIMTSSVEEEQRSNAAEGKLITTVSGRKYILGVAETHDSLADQLEAARCEWRELQKKLHSLKRGELQLHKRPRGHAPEGYYWDALEGGWFDECGLQYVKVKDKKRKIEAIEKKVAKAAAEVGAAAVEAGEPRTRVVAEVGAP